jgi:hypothetical protein
MRKGLMKRKKPCKAGLFIVSKTDGEQKGIKADSPALIFF